MNAPGELGALRPFALWLVIGLSLQCASSSVRAEAELDLFYRLPVSTSSNLPPSAIFPRGRTMAFMGYSGQPARDLTNGFTVAGPVYGSQGAYLEQCFTHGWPVVAQIGFPLRLADERKAKLPQDRSLLRDQIEDRVRSLAAHSEIAWWAILPEELRPWRTDEMQYLATVCSAIRQADPEQRPLYLYNPNHRDAGTLLPVAREVDVLAKGCYVNHVGRKQQRVWVRWTVEQELEAIRAAGRSNAIALLMPELCHDPEPAEDAEIRNWVRHDVYLGLASGAKGVLVWSLYPRAEVRRTWQLWYDAYAECGRELNKGSALSQIFLFGERRSDLRIKLREGEATASVTLGGSVEPTTTSQRERAQRQLQLPAWTSAEFAYGSCRWLFLINSANSPASFDIAGWPKGSRAENVFDGATIPLDGAALPVKLPACGVAALRFTKAG